MLDHIRAEVIGVFIGFEDVDYHSAVAPEGRDGSLTNPAEHGLKPRERLLDGIKVGAAGWQEAQLCTGRFKEHCTDARLWLDRLSTITTSPSGISDIRTCVT
jgi:hypothetical protein